MAGRIVAGLLCCALFLSLAAPVVSVDDAEWDPNEFEGFSDDLQAEGSSEFADSVKPAPLYPNGADQDESLEDGDFDAPKQSKPKIVLRQRSVTTSAKNYYKECAGIVFIALFVLNFFIGRKKNLQIADSWWKLCEPLLEAQFAAMGLSSSKPGEVMMKESPALFKVYASGRRHCQGLVAELELVSRQDLFSQVLAFVNQTEDILTLDIPLTEEMGTFVFALVRKKDSKAMHSENKDLSDYAKVMPLELLPKPLVALTDCPEAITDLLPPVVLKTLRERIGLFRSLHFTDQNTIPVLGTTTVSTKMARFRFRVPPPSRMGELQRLIEMSLWYVDLLGQKVRLSRAARACADAARKKVLDRRFRAGHEDRLERLQQRKADQRQREEEEYANLTEEQKRRRDARDAKKKNKKSNPRFRMKMGTR